MITYKETLAETTFTFSTVKTFAVRMKKTSLATLLNFVLYGLNES